MREVLVRLGWQIGRRGAFLLFLSVLDFIFAYGLAFPTARSAGNPTTMFLASILPLWAWGLAWALVGLSCLVFAFRRKDRIGYAAAMSLKAFWAVLFLIGWLFAGVERGYLSTAIWGAFGFIVWLISGWQENPAPKENPQPTAQPVREL
jgi:nitrate reductase NapE component